MPITARQQRIRALIPRDSLGKPPNGRMRQLDHLLASSAVEDHTLSFIEREVKEYRKIWARRVEYLNMAGQYPQATTGSSPQGASGT